MKDTRFNCPTMIGSMPQKDPEEACSVIERFLKDIPCWPQLPNRSLKEGMAAQFSEGFPGIAEKDNNLYIDSSAITAANWKSCISPTWKTTRTNIR
jgi:hypothetical protein